MASPALRMSRRKLLQIGSVAPLSALLLAGNATDAQIAAVAKSLDGPTEDALWNKAKNVPGANEQNFRKAVRILVEYFVAGAADKGLDVPQGKQRRLFVDVAYEQMSGTRKSGDLIAERSPGWENLMYQTTVCAYLCGAEFAIAGADFNDETTLPNAYKVAFNIVKETMTILLMRVRKGKSDPGGAPGGAGC